tara:strand:+ start:2441 stop:3034 length:594 start_codon:yes stop_codon:yes gene_type:complete
MTFDEFKIWMLHHKKQFTSIADRLKDPDTIQAWYRVVKAVPLEEAKQISDDMFSGVESPPKFFDSHPKAIRAIWNKRTYGESTTLMDDPDKPKEKIVDGEPVYTCIICHDFGDLSVWHPVAMRAAYDNTFERSKHIRKCTVACSCRYGQSKNKKRKSPWLEFDKSRMLPFWGSWPTEVDRLHDFVQPTPTEWTPDEP